jgi:hypothetical protein
MLNPTMREGNSTFIEYWDTTPSGAKVRAYLEKVSIRFQGDNPLKNASDPNWFVSVNGAGATNVESAYTAVGKDKTKLDVKVHSHLDAGDNITFTFELIREGQTVSEGGKLVFWDWNGAPWTATVNMIARPTDDVQPVFNLKKGLA